MRLIFAGTPEFAATSLNALAAAKHEIVLVLTQPDRPAGRGLRLELSAVKKEAQKQRLTIYQPQTLKNDDAAKRIRDVDADAMIVAAYGLILPKPLLQIPRLGCINIHASLLPRWRGAAPIQRAIVAGDSQTGITIMQMDEGLDTGDMLAQRSLPIGESETAGELHDRLAKLGAQMINEVLDAPLNRLKQDSALATYAAKISKGEARLDWKEDALTLHRKIRAFNPFPGAMSIFEGETIKIWRANLHNADAVFGAPGTVSASPPGTLVIACGSGALSVLELQRAGGKRMATAAFLGGFPIAAGARFGVSAPS